MTDAVIEAARDGLNGEREEVGAASDIPGGSILRLATFYEDGDWVERVQVGEPGDWITVFEGHGLAPTQRYNALVDDLTHYDVGE